MTTDNFNENSGNPDLPATDGSIPGRAPRVPDDLARPDDQVFPAATPAPERPQRRKRNLLVGAAAAGTLVLGGLIGGGVALATANDSGTFASGQTGQTGQFSQNGQNGQNGQPGQFGGHQDGDGQPGGGMGANEEQVTDADTVAAITKSIQAKYDGATVAAIESGGPGGSSAAAYHARVSVNGQTKLVLLDKDYKVLSELAGPGQAPGTQQGDDGSGDDSGDTA